MVGYKHLTGLSFVRRPSLIARHSKTRSTQSTSLATM